MLASLLGIGSYVTFYFFIVDVRLPIRFPKLWARDKIEIQVRFIGINGEWTAYPDYQGLPHWFFAPLHEFDRTHLRPHKWAGTTPRNEVLSFDWLKPTPAPTQP